MLYLRDTSSKFLKKDRIYQLDYCIEMKLLKKVLYNIHNNIIKITCCIMNYLICNNCSVIFMQLLGSNYFRASNSEI